MKIKKSHKSFGGETQFYSHNSSTTGTEMNFSVFVPTDKPTSAIIFLSGLTCSEENFITKSGIQSILAGSSTMIICPDTSPRGLDLPGEHEPYDFGSGAGFYVKASTEGYKDHYNMYDYVNEDIYNILLNEFDIPTDKIAITGHSMGGHGALTLGLRNSEKYASVSAFSPIVNPINCDWGKKAFTGYLGEDQELWKNYDACELVSQNKTHPQKILIDQGTSDEFLEKQLLTDNFEKICFENGQPVEINMREGYDHSYYFISSFLLDHIKFHQEAMKV